MEGRSTGDGRTQLVVDELELSVLHGALVAARDDASLSSHLDLPRDATAQLVETLLSALAQAQALTPDPAATPVEPAAIPPFPSLRHEPEGFAHELERAIAEEDDHRALAATYLEQARRHSLWSETAVQTVSDQIQRDGHWEDTIEWRAFTTTAVRIAPVSEQSGRFFEVTIDCDGSVTFRSPTLERALERLCVYDVIVRDLFWTSGWSSWATVDRLEATSEEHPPR